MIKKCIEQSLESHLCHYLELNQIVHFWSATFLRISTCNLLK